MGQLTSVAPGHIPQVRDRHLPTGFLRRLIHDDVNATFRYLQQVAKATEEALIGLTGSKNRLLDAHNTTVDVVDAHGARIRTLENHRNEDIAATNQTAHVVDGHTARINALDLETNNLKGRVRQLEETREKDRLASKETVAIIDQHSQKIVEALKQIQSLQQARENCANQLKDMTMNNLEVAEKIHALLASKEELKAMLVSSERRMDLMAQTIQQLTAAMALLTSRPANS